MRQFASSVFASDDRDFVFVQKETWAEPGCQYLEKSSFWGNVGDHRLCQIASASSSFGGTTLGLAPADGMRVKRVGDRLILSDAKGYATPLNLLPNDKAAQLLRSCEFVPAPEAYVPEHLARLPDGRMFYVEKRESGLELHVQHAYLGTPGAMQRIQLAHFQQSPLTSAGIICTSAGIFFEFTDTNGAIFKPNSASHGLAVKRYTESEIAGMLPTLGLNTDTTPTLNLAPQSPSR